MKMNILKNNMDINNIQQAFNNTLFYKSVMIKNSLDTHFGHYNHNIIEENGCYFVVEMKPQSYMKKLKPIKVKFEFIPSNYGQLNKINKISLI